MIDYILFWMAKELGELAFVLLFLLTIFAGFFLYLVFMRIKYKLFGKKTQ